MTDHKDPFEEQLREALRSSGDRTDHPGLGEDSSELLERIHRGAARRRARRRAGGLVATAALVSAILVTLPLLTPPPSDDETANGPAAGRQPEQPSVSPGEGTTERGRRSGPVPKAPPTVGGKFALDAEATLKPAVPVEVEDLRVTSVSAPSADEFWVSGYGNCNDEDLCNVLGHSANGGADLEFRTLPVSGPSRLTTVRFSEDGATGWATDGGGVYRTDSGGKAWTPLRQPAGVRVSELEVWEDEVWAVGSRPASQETVVLASHRLSYELVPVQESRDLAPLDAVALGPETFGLRHDDPERNFARTSDGGSQWAETEIGCEPADVSAADDVAWVLCGDDQALVRSTDQGVTWLPPESLDSAAVVETLTKVAAIDADTAFVAGSGVGWVVQNRVAKPANGIGEGSYSYASFSTEEVGYLIGDDGHLCRTVDGGYTWQRVELP